MTDRIKLTIEIDRPSGKSDDMVVGYIEGVFDYLNAVVRVIHDRDTRDILHPQHNEGES